MFMCKAFYIQLICLVVSTERIHGREIPVASVAPPSHQPADSELSETGFAGAVQAASKYFQYAHVPAKDHYEFGHKRGNDHHFIERHEKAHPHEGEFKTKVRWGDKHGGYGEHYWDYNHAGHDGEGEESQNRPQYAPYPEDSSEEKSNRPSRRAKIDPDVEFIDGESKARIESGQSSKHGGNYRRPPEDFEDI